MSFLLSRFLCNKDCLSFFSAPEYNKIERIHMMYVKSKETVLFYLTNYFVEYMKNE